MPACANESLDKYWSRSANGCCGHDLFRNGNGSSPGSPPLAQRSPSSPESERRPVETSSSFPPPDLFVDSAANSGKDGRPGLLVSLFGWYPLFVLRFARNLIATIIYLTWSQFLLFVPTVYFTGCLWLFWKCFQPPLNLLKWSFAFLYTSPMERFRKKRTAVVSCGSTVQALHMSRNLYRAGFRVVVFEIEGHFGLARFSTAVDKFYTVPEPRGETGEAYLSAIINLVEREKASYYIPISATSAAYYDAMVKPHLEILGCVTFCPGVKEVILLDDTYEVMKRCGSDGMATPLFYPVNCNEDIIDLYRKGVIRSAKHVMVNVGIGGVRNRVKLEMPSDIRDLRIPQPVTRQRPWLVMREDGAGERFVTSTTIKDNMIAANVTCRLEPDGGLTPVHHPQIDVWMRRFMAKLRFLRPVSGHVSFRFVESSSSGSLVPLGCRVGVGLPYVCYNSLHPRIVCKPCRHFDTNNFGPLVNKRGRYWMHELIINTVKSPPGIGSLFNLICTLLFKREFLFVHWDPLPYCAYYHLQLPLTNIYRFLRGHPVYVNKIRHSRFNRALSVAINRVPTVLKSPP